MWGMSQHVPRRCSLRLCGEPSTAQYSKARHGAAQDRTGQGVTGQGRAGQDRTGHDRTEPARDAADTDSASRTHMQHIKTIRELQHIWIQHVQHAALGTSLHAIVFPAHGFAVVAPHHVV